MATRCLALLLIAVATSAGAAEPAKDAAAYRQYTFAWPFTDDSAMRPRGGTTSGPDVTLQTRPSEAWQRLTTAELTPLERDRQAILAMAGGYRTSFDFIETVGFTPDYEPARPYQSWGTEYIYVVADEPRFISLQHVLVMTFEDEDGRVSGPMVVKHWRQDWRYQDRDLHTYRGEGVWERERRSAAEAAGRWSQAVYQVDDSPRYEATGEWVHYPTHSIWTSGKTWRPLPRREFSVRDDYHVLAGVNRVTILPRGWVHEEDNLKLVLDGAGEPAAGTPYLAREAGVNRYEHIVGYDFSAGDAYWSRTGPFWAEVRAAWGELLAGNERFRIRDRVDGEPLFAVMFRLAETFDTADGDRDELRERVDAVLDRFIDRE